MEGALYKWHGYFSGWTLKYFVLHNGSVCYYNSKSDRETNKPAVETFNMGLCEIVVDQHVPGQWELRNTVESKVWHLRTDSAPERHQWIKALGSAKACLLDTSSLGNFSRSVSVESSSRLLSVDQPSTDHLERFSVNGSMYFDPIRVDLQTTNDSGNGSLNNLLLTSDTSSFVNSNCNVEETNHMNKLSSQCEKTVENIRQLQQCLDGQHSSNHVEDRIKLVENSVKTLSKLMGDCKALLSDPSEMTGTEQEYGDDISMENSVESLEPDGLKTSTPKTIDQGPCVGTFFNSCKTDFGDVLSAIVKCGEKNLVPTELFLDSCQCYMNFFERFAGTLMGPLKSDIQGNIDKIRKVLKINPGYKYLEDILNTEIPAKQHTGPDTGTQALLWMTRGLRVMCQFLRNVLSEDSDSRFDTSTSLVTSYNNLLSKHHNWMVQRLFKMGLKMIPAYDAFKISMTNPDSLEALKSSGSLNWEQLIEKEIMMQGLLYSDRMEKVTLLIYDMYQQNNIQM